MIRNTQTGRKSCTVLRVSENLRRENQDFGVVEKVAVGCVFKLFDAHVLAFNRLGCKIQCKQKRAVSFLQ